MNLLNSQEINANVVLILLGDIEANLIQKIDYSEIIAMDELFPLSIEAVWDMIVAPESAFRKRFIGPESFNRAIKVFEKSFETTKDEMFRSHLLTDSDVRAAVEQTIAADDPEAYKCISALNDKDVLIVDSIDDPESDWKDIRDIILNYYTPKSVKRVKVPRLQ